MTDLDLYSGEQVRIHVDLTVSVAVRKGIFRPTVEWKRLTPDQFSINTWWARAIDAGSGHYSIEVPGRPVVA